VLPSENEQYTHMAVMEDGKVLMDADEIAKAIANVVERPTVLLIHTRPSPHYVTLVVEDLVIFIDKLLNRFKEYNKKFLGMLISFDDYSRAIANSFIDRFVQVFDIKGEEKEKLKKAPVFDFSTLVFEKNLNIKDKVKVLELQLDTVYYAKSKLKDVKIAGLYLLKPLSLEERVPPIIRGRYLDPTLRVIAIGAVARLLSSQNRDVILYDSLLLDVALLSKKRRTVKRRDLVQKYLGVKALVGIHPLYHPEKEKELIIQSLMNNNLVKFSQPIFVNKNNYVDSAVTCLTELYWSLCLTIVNSILKIVIDHNNLSIRQDVAKLIKNALDEILGNDEYIYRTPIASFFFVQLRGSEKDKEKSQWKFLDESMPNSWRSMLEEWKYPIHGQSLEYVILKNLSDYSTSKIYTLDIVVTVTKSSITHQRFRTSLKALLTRLQQVNDNELIQSLWGRGKQSIITEIKQCLGEEKDYKTHSSTLKKELQNRSRVKIDLCKEALTYVKETVEMFLE